MSTPIRSLTLVWTLVWFVLAGFSGVSAKDDAFEAIRSEARTALVGRLLDLATWCNGNKLFEERDRVWRAVIELDTDNLDARKGLRYGRNVDGSWREPSPRPAKNMDKAALAELPARRADVVRPYADTILGYLDESDVPFAVRRAVLREILAVDPDDAEAHRRLGETRLEDRWVLAETITAKARRAEIRSAVQAAKAAPPGVLPAAATEEETRLFPDWKCGAQSPAGRVLGTGDASDCEGLANYCRITGEVFQSVLGSPPPWAEGFGLYLVTGKGEKERFVAGLPDLTDSQREALVRTIGGGISGTWKIALFEPDPIKRLDCGIRHSLAHLLRRKWNIGTEQAWIFEGLGLYLTREICGTRLTWFSSGSGTKNEGKLSPRGKLMVSGANWMNEGYQLFTRERPVQLTDVLHRDIASMGLDDVLASYVLAAYLVEGRPDALPTLLEQVGQGVPPEDAVQSALGMSVPELQDQLARWLSERR